MFTAVQEASARRYASRVVFGAPHKRIAGTLGPIALFAPGAIVAYRVRQDRYAAGCVFRAACDGGPGDPLPGVRPPPTLLIGFVRGRIFARAVLLLRELGRRGVVDALDNEAYLRAAFALARPDLDVRLLADVLEAPWTF